MKRKSFIFAAIACCFTVILLLTCQSLINPEAGNAKATVFSWSSLNTIHDTASINDTVKVIVTYSNLTRKIKLIEWYVDTLQTPLQTKIDSSKSGRDTLTYYCPAQAGLKRLIVQAVDTANTVWKDTFKLWVIQDAPVANAGNDTAVELNDTIRLHGSATQRFGTIVKWEWKIGSGSWNTTAGPDTWAIMPSANQVYTCSLAVTDDDGNRSMANKLIYPFLLSVSGGGNSSFILKRTDGTLWACGNNRYGQLGTGDTISRSVPVQVMSDVRSMSMGGSHSLILKNDGTLWACGSNNLGQLGTGDTIKRLLPIEVMSNVQSMSAGDVSSLIIKSDGTLWCCGCGIGSWAWTPRFICDSVRSVSAGYIYCYIMTDGTLWGSGGSSSITDVQSVSVGEYAHTLFIKNDNTLWGWGVNFYGELGDGTTTDHYPPVQVMSDVRSAAAGYECSLILKNDGTLLGCGLGYGVIPIQLMNDVQSMAIGWPSDLIVKNDGTLWTSGHGTPVRITLP
jgi:alpha-tubulin suppressor-like RCC1 family protein